MLISCNKLKPEGHGTEHCTSPLEILYMRKEREFMYQVHEISPICSCLETRHFGRNIVDVFSHIISIKITSINFAASLAGNRGTGNNRSKCSPQ